MSCINPLQLSIKSNGRRKNIEVPCGHCLNCMVKKQSSLEFLCKKELNENYRKGYGASFVTLTYDDSHLPINDLGFMTLRRSDVQKFIKNMRRQMEYYNCYRHFKYIYCGELGDSTSRPHYHLIFIGLSDSEVKKYTRKLWKYGLCDVGSLGAGGIRYVLKYMTKALPSKNVKKLRENCHVENPFVYHSIGMGKNWIINNLQKIVDEGFTFNINGKIQLFPKYVMQFVSNHTGVDYHRYVTEYLQKYENNKAKAKGISFSQHDFENSYISYKNKVYALRSKNMPVDDITLNKAWVKPNHSIDRRTQKQKELVELAIYGDVVPF